MATKKAPEMGAASEERIEETVLALLYVCSVCEDGARRSWKTYDWGVTEHLFEKGLIDNPRSNRKSVLLTPEGEALGKVLAEKLFGGSVR